MADNQEALSLISDQAGRLLEATATPERLKSLLEEPGSFDGELWQKTVELGWPAAAIPEELGGLGLGWDGLCALAEHLGAATASLPLIENTLAVETLAGAAAGHTDVIEALVSGEAIATLALLDAGDTGFGAPSRVTMDEAGLKGNKALAAFAAVADYALVYVLDRQSAEPALVLVALDQPGVSREQHNAIDNARGAAALCFDNAAATAIASGADATAQVMRLAARAAIATAFDQVGGARACLDQACDYARERQVFGQPIGAFQGIKHKLADIYADIEVARGCALDALAVLDSNDAASLPYAAAARVAAISAYDHAARENIQVHGGIGVTWESAQHHYYRRARSLALEWGVAAYWREVLVDNVEMLAGGY
jgi:alkylation response protein AidB-like acyl-CoA dehydrogenase